MAKITFVPPEASEVLKVKVEALQVAAGSAETAFGAAYQLPALTWGRKSKVAAAQAAYDAAMAALREAEAEMAASLDYEAQKAADEGVARQQGRQEAIEAALLFDPNLKANARAGRKNAANELAAVAKERSALALREANAVEMANAANTILQR